MDGHEKLSSVDYYELLGVKEDDHVSIIHSAYRRVSRKYHPDKISNPEQIEKFFIIQKAWGVLKDSTSRTQYDNAKRSATISLSRVNSDAGDVTCRCGTIIQIFHESESSCAVQCYSCSEFHFIDA